MRRFFLTLFFLGAVFLSSSAAYTLQESLPYAYPGVDEIEVIGASAMSCELSSLPSSPAELFLTLYDDCGFKAYEKENTSKVRLILYSKTGFSTPQRTLYAKTSGSLYQMFSKYYSHWELRGSFVSDVLLSERWRVISISSLVEELNKTYFVQARQAEKRFYVLEKLKAEKVASQKSYYSLLYPFSELNLDFYELVKGYFATTDVVQYTRDGQYYLKMTGSEVSREALSKVYSNLLGILDDKTTRANQLGAYFPETERQYLEMLYSLLRKSQIRSFRSGELLTVSSELLSPKGMEMYAESLQTTPTSEPGELNLLPEPPPIDAPVLKSKTSAALPQHSTPSQQTDPVLNDTESIDAAPETEKKTGQKLNAPDLSVGSLPDGVVLPKTLPQPFSNAGEIQ